MAHPTRRAVQIAGVLVTLIGLIDLPDQLHKWAEAASRLQLDQDAARWILVGVGVLIVLAAQFWPSWGSHPAGLTPAGAALTGIARTPVLPPPGLATPHPQITPGIGDDRIFVDATPEYLVSHFKGKTSVHGQDAVKRFEGKWLRVSGPLGDVMSQLVTFQYGTFKVSVYMVFEPRSRTLLELMVPGTQITACGRIVRVTRSEVELERCELVG